MAESSSKRRKTFDGRADTLLKQTRQLATLCGSPACIVIYNPDDAIRPWRIWPDNEADFLNVIHTYKKTKKPKRQAAEKSRVSRGRKAATTVDDVGPSSSSQSRGLTSTIASDGNGLRALPSTCLAIDQTISQATFDSITVPPLQRPQAAATSGQESVLAGMVEAWAGKEQALWGREWETGEAQAAATIADAAGIHSSSANAAQFAHDTSCDGLLSCDWGDTGMFELDTLLNSNAPLTAATTVGKEQALWEREAWEALPANTTIADAAGIHSVIATAAQFTHDTSFDGLLSCDWGNTEMFELDALLNSSDDQGMMLL